MSRVFCENCSYAASKGEPAFANCMDCAERTRKTQNTNIRFNLLFCKICHVAAQHILVKGKWQCTAPIHPSRPPEKRDCSTIN